IADKMTVSLWLRTGLNHDGTFLYQDGSGIHYRIRNDGHLRALINTEAGGSWLDYAGITDNEWHHIVVTYDGSEGRLYVDNNLADSVLLTGNLKTNANSLLIGTKLGDWYFNGMIDEIRIYNYSLSEAEIEGLYYGKEEIILFLHNPEFDYLLLSFIVLIAVIISIIELGVRRRCKP
ncbi:MAG: LamG domain-containing protein, partial [Promethearchaeota archaeon]